MKVETRLQRYSEAIKVAGNGSAPKHLKEIVALLKQGLGGIQIATELGIGKSYVYSVLKDPHRTAERARKYRNTCEVCGAAIRSDNPGGAPQRWCQTCLPDVLRKWTRQRIIEAIREYHARYGRPPAAYDWNVAHARRVAAPERLREIKERWEAGDWPNQETVRGMFGLWNDAIRAAGFEPVSSGSRRDPDRWKRNMRMARWNTPLPTHPIEEGKKRLHKIHNRKDRR